MGTRSTGRRGRSDQAGRDGEMRREDRRRFHARLRAAGLLLGEGRGYVRDDEEPLELPGTPLSEIVVEGRG